MRVLRVSHSAVVDEWRGRERALAQFGVDVMLLSASRSREGGGFVELQPRPGERVTGVTTLGSHPALFLYDPRPLWHALGESWDVIDIHEEPFALATAEILLIRALRRNRAAVVLYTAQNIHKRYPIPFRWLERWALRTAAGISACNHEAAAIAERKGYAGRARVIPLGIDPARFGPDDASKRDDVSPSDRSATVGFAGRLVPEKGLHVLFEAAGVEPRIRLRVVGAGPMYADLAVRAAAPDLAGRVAFAGGVAPSEIAAFYREIDVLAIPSIPTPTWTEQFGRVAVEAMACGIPVVSSDAGALPDVVGGAGIVVPSGDARALAAALIEASGHRAGELRAAGLKRAEECSWSNVARQYVDLYLAAMHEPRQERRSVEVIVVAYGNPVLLRRAMEPLAGMSLTVVDNSSLTEIDDLCRELGARYIDAGGNRGFAAGVNIGLAARQNTDSDVLLLNPDARITADAVGILQNALRSRGDLASVGAAQTDSSGSPSRVLWTFPSPANAWLEAVGLGRLQFGGRFVIGSVLLLRAEALAQVGGFDERFFLYAEETDWAYRAHRLGWRHAVVRSATAIHEGAGSSTDALRRELHFHASKERYLRKHFGTAGWQVTRTAVVLGEVTRSIVRRGDRAHAARQRVGIYVRGPLRLESRFARGSGSA